jgi:formylglycine-generating enzyme required for sulfatase activity
MARRFRWSMLALILAAVWVMGAGAAVEAQPGRYTKSPDGVILDSVTGLEWYVNPNRDNTWNEAKAWADGLTVAGGGWRLPTLAELKAQYRKGASAVNMDPLFQLPGAYVWSGDLKDPQFAWGFAFYSGLEGFHSVKYGFGRVALAVRSRR